MNLSNRVFFASFFTAIVFVLSACGGGGGGGSGVTATSSSAPPATSSSGSGTGKVVLIIGDDDINDWDQAIFEITEILLIGEDGSHVVILDEMRIIDFLALETVNEVLADATVPAMTYTKLRFAVQSITLRKLADPYDPTSEIIDEADVAVPSGKADVNPQGDHFTVGEDQNLVIQIEIPLEDAIKFHKTGNGNGTWKFRPVIFAKVLTVDDPGGLIRVFGNEVQLLAAIQLLETEADNAFDLCQIKSIAEVNPLQDDGDCIRIVVDEDTCFFALVGGVLQLVGPDALMDGDAATVYGFADPTADQFTINAEIVAIGAAGAYVIMEGEAEGIAEGDPPSFPFEPDGSEVEMTVVLIEGSKLYNRHGEPAELGAIMEDIDVEAEGHFVPSGGNDRLDAFVAFVDDDPDDRVEGILDVIDLANSKLTLIDEDDPMTEFCVLYDDDTVFFRVIGDDDDDLIESGEISASDLELGVEVDASGEFVGDCLDADVIILEVEGDEVEPV